MSLDLSTVPGVSDAWPDFAPNPWGAEAVSLAVADYLTSDLPPGLRTAFAAKPITWDDPADFFGAGVPWGASLFVYIGTEDQGTLFLGQGKPGRFITHRVALVGLFRCTINDTAGAMQLERRIEDGVKDMLRADPSLGGRVFQAAITTLTAQRTQPREWAPGHEVDFLIEFEVSVPSPPPAA